MKAIIIGGGIGGLTTAIALQQQGIDFEIYEAAPELKEVGAGIVLGPNAMKVLHTLGLGKAIRENSVFLKRGQVKTHDEILLQTVDGEGLRQAYGHGLHAIHRASLQHILASFVDKPIHTGHRFERLEQDGQGVKAFFTNGVQVAGDILIGADGIRSLVREKYVGPARYRYSGQTCWRAVIDLDLPPDQQTTTAELWGRAAGLRASYVKVGPGQVYFYFTKCMPAGRSFSNEEALQLIGRELKPFRGYIQQILHHLDPETLIHTDLWDFHPIPRWYRDRVVLLGDAAHATTPNLGQGASQAIEDALVLAGCLAENPVYPQAFSAYQRRRMPCARWVVGRSYQLGQVSNLGGSLGFALKKALFRMVPEWVARRQLAYLYGGE